MYNIKKKKIFKRKKTVYFPNNFQLKKNRTGFLIGSSLAEYIVTFSIQCPIGNDIGFQKENGVA